MLLKVTVLILAAFGLVQCQPELQPNRCRFGWKQFGDGCYYYFQTPKSWWRARQYCRGYGADLGCISSRAENDFVADLTGGVKAWIGLRDMLPLSTSNFMAPLSLGAETWEWTDGSRYRNRYTNWATGQPSGFQDCVQINWGGKGKWDDQDFWSQIGFVCERPREES